MGEHGGRLGEMSEHGVRVGGGAVGERGGRVRSVFVINSYYHSREVRTSTTASTS